MNLQYSVQVPKPIDSKKKYPSNYVSTTKYNLITFLPLSLLIQFKRYANVYFLACAILQSIPLISPLSPLSAVLPLLFVLFLSMAREGYEDLKRWQSDKASNSSKTTIVQRGEQRGVAWSIIRPGNFLKITSQQLVPVDMIPLYCSQTSGISYVQTSSLDGEKNLKPKLSLPQIQLAYNRQQQICQNDFKIKVTCDQPNADINIFGGRIYIKYLQNEINSELNHKNLILRGTKIKNTGWVIGLAIYTGYNTKIMKNGCQSLTKVSNLQVKVNTIILFLILFQVLCCGISSVYCLLSCQNMIQFQRLISEKSDVNCIATAAISFGSYFILYSTFIPISLIVSLQFVKVFQGYAMHKDQEMYCASNQRSMESHSVSINQQLGQIQYILTDKTGTLTCNKMVFKNIIVGKNVYGDDIRLYEVDRKFDFRRLTQRYSNVMTLKNRNTYKYFDTRGINFQLSQVKQQPNSFQQNEQNSHKKKAIKKKQISQQKKSGKDIFSSAHKKQIELIFYIITTCHQCLRQTKPCKPINGLEKEDGEKEIDLSRELDQMEIKSSYHGPSPDQVALLNAAKKIGFQFINTQNKITTIMYNRQEIKFKILKIFEFNSDRKRMTVVVEWIGIGAVMAFVKGADSSIRKILSPNQKYLQFISQKTTEMSKTGLRSLWFAYKMLPNLLNYEQVQITQIQKDLTLLGATGIQDRLQDYVPQTIYSLKQGGIKFIMLTGDKLQTAQNIARSCNMIGEGILIDNANKLDNAIQQICDQKNIMDKSVCPVIDGSAINFADNQEKLLEIVKVSESAVFCRVTPNQKAQIVKIVKKLGKLTLAIGDGANDVNMIQEANVGVGIFGEEGMRAAQVSDYAIGQFCLLWKLLLCYGRLNYMRIAQMILYFFYKNMVFTIVQFVYSFYCLGSGMSFWLSWSITCYNMVFTFFPVVLRAVFEVDVEVQSNKTTLKQLSEGDNQNRLMYQYYPKMYLVSQKNQMFTNLIFLAWFVLGILQGVVCFMITIYSMDGIGDSSGVDSYGTGFYFVELSSYTSVIIVVTLKLAINVRNWNIVLVVGFLIPSLGAYVAFCFLMNNVTISDSYEYWTELIQVPSFYQANVLAILGMFTVDLFLFSIEATKNNFQNYFKKRTLMRRRMTEQNLQALFDSLQKKKGFQ